MPSWPNISAAKSRTHYTARAMKAEAERDAAIRRAERAEEQVIFLRKLIAAMDRKSTKKSKP